MHGYHHFRMVYNRKAYTPLSLWLFSMVIIILTSCFGPPQAAAPTNSGRILLWHAWGDTGAEALDTIIKNYTSVHPGVTIIAVDMSDEDLQASFSQTAALGLGPDLLIGSSDWMHTFIEQDIISDIEPQGFEQIIFNSAALELTRHEEGIYGIPLTLQSPALYYNQDRLSPPIPNTYSTLVDLAADGHPVGISINARTAYAAISAFGPRPFNVSDETVLSIEPEGIIAWFNWLQGVQENPAFILSQDEETLSRLFLNQEIDLYLGPYSFLEQYQALEAADEAPFSLGVVSLPLGNLNFSNPLIQADILYFNQASSARQARLALDFAQFLTNNEQGSFLLRELEVAPANFRVRVDRRIYPHVQPIAQSANLGTTLPVILQPILLGTNGNATYTAVLSGAREPEEAFCEWHAEIKAVWPGAIESVGFCQTTQ